MRLRRFYWLLVGGFFWVVPVKAQEAIARQYIEEYKQLAVSHMVETGCPASIILAIAMHESANGKSRIASHLNNHFGIKGPNSNKTIRSAYKGYSSVEDSYADFIRYLRDRKGTKDLFGKHAPNDYKSWVKGIARAGYAQSSSWSNKVIQMIERYDLDEVDLLHPEAATWVKASEEIDLSSSEQQIHTVKKGDTLSHIARKYHSTVAKIMQANQLSTTKLKIGQRLRITNEL